MTLILWLVLSKVPCFEAFNVAIRPDHRLPITLNVLSMAWALGAGEQLGVLSSAALLCGK